MGSCNSCFTTTDITKSSDRKPTDSFDAVVHPKFAVVGGVLSARERGGTLPRKHSHRHTHSETNETAGVTSSTPTTSAHDHNPPALTSPHRKSVVTFTENVCACNGEVAIISPPENVREGEVTNGPKVFAAHPSQLASFVRRRGFADPPTLTNIEHPLRRVPDDAKGNKREAETAATLPATGSENDNHRSLHKAGHGRNPSLMAAVPENLLHVRKGPSLCSSSFSIIPTQPSNVAATTTTANKSSPLVAQHTDQTSAQEILGDKLHPIAIAAKGPLSIEGITPVQVVSTRPPSGNLLPPEDLIMLRCGPLPMSETQVTKPPKQNLKHHRSSSVNEEVTTPTYVERSRGSTSVPVQPSKPFHQGDALIISPQFGTPIKKILVQQQQPTQPVHVDATEPLELDAFSLPPAHLSLPEIEDADAAINEANKTPHRHHQTQRSNSISDILPLVYATGGLFVAEMGRIALVNANASVSASVSAVSTNAGSRRLSISQLTPQSRKLPSKSIHVPSDAELLADPRFRKAVSQAEAFNQSRVEGPFATLSATTSVTPKLECEEEDDSRFPRQHELGFGAREENDLSSRPLVGLVGFGQDCDTSPMLGPSFMPPYVTNSPSGNPDPNTIPLFPSFANPSLKIAASSFPNDDFLTYSAPIYGASTSGSQLPIHFQASRESVNSQQASAFGADNSVWDAVSHSTLMASGTQTQGVAYQISASSPEVGHSGSPGGFSSVPGILSPAVLARHIQQQRNAYPSNLGQMANNRSPVPLMNGTLFAPPTFTSAVNAQHFPHLGYPNIFHPPAVPYYPTPLLPYPNMYCPTPFQQPYPLTAMGHLPLAIPQMPGSGPTVGGPYVTPSNFASPSLESPGGPRLTPQLTPIQPTQSTRQQFKSQSHSPTTLAFALPRMGSGGGLYGYAATSLNDTLLSNNFLPSISSSAAHVLAQHHSSSNNLTMMMTPTKRHSVTNPHSNTPLQHVSINTPTTVQVISTSSSTNELQRTEGSRGQLTDTVPYSTLPTTAVARSLSDRQTAQNTSFTAKPMINLCAPLPHHQHQSLYPHHSQPLQPLPGNLSIASSIVLQSSSNTTNVSAMVNSGIIGQSMSKTNICPPIAHAASSVTAAEEKMDVDAPAPEWWTALQQYALIGDKALSSLESPKEQKTESGENKPDGTDVSKVGIAKVPAHPDPTLAISKGNEVTSGYAYKDSWGMQSKVSPSAKGFPDSSIGAGATTPTPSEVKVVDHTTNNQNTNNNFQYAEPVTSNIVL